MALQFSTPGTTGVLTGLQSAVATGGGAATIQLFTSGTVIAVFTLPAPEFTLSGERLKLNGPVASANATASQDPSGWRLYDRNGALVVTGTVGESGADLYCIEDVNATSGQPQQLNELVFSVTATGGLRSQGSFTLT